MNYWKGLVIAAALDAAWLMGSPARANDPESLPAYTVNTVMELPVAEPAGLDTISYDGVGFQEDSLMSFLNDHPADVDAMQQLATLYADNGWYEQAIGPLARALQLDPDRRALWSALDSAVDRSGRAKITDAELTRRAAAFAESVAMWGMEC